MFNLNLVSKALHDTHLDDFAFRLLCYVEFEMEKQNSTKIEVYIQDLVDMFGWKETKVKDTLRQLSEYGYIIKRYTYTKGRKKPVEINAVYNNEPECLGSPERPESDRMGSPERPETTFGVAGAAIPSRSILLGPNRTDSNSARSEKSIRNDYVTTVFNTVKQKLEKLKQVKDKKSYLAVDKEISLVMDEVRTRYDYFTDAQWKYMLKLSDSWEKIGASRDKYFKPNRTTGMTSVEDNEPQEYNEIQSSISYLGENSEPAPWEATG